VATLAGVAGLLGCMGAVVGGEHPGGPGYPHHQLAVTNGEVIWGNKKTGDRGIKKLC
jgi:hypothetical protein